MAESCLQWPNQDKFERSKTYIVQYNNMALFIVLSAQVLNHPNRTYEYTQRLRIAHVIKTFDPV